MTKSEDVFHQVATQISGSEKSQMFGKPCYKIGGKAFVCFFQDEMVFKLNDPHKTEALALDGSSLFDPSGKGRAMKEWVQLPVVHEQYWSNYAGLAAKYVSG